VFQVISDAEKADRIMFDVSITKGPANTNRNTQIKMQQIFNDKCFFFNVYAFIDNLE